MKKLLFLLAAAALTACATEPPARVSRMDWSEPADPAATDSAAWLGVEKTQASFGSIDVRYPRNAPYTGATADEATVTGWRGERVSAQVVVWTAEELKNLRCTVGDFVGENGKLAGIGRARFVKYGLANRFSHKVYCGPRPEGEVPHLEPNLLSEERSLDVAAQTLRPVWITVDIPAEAKPGTYRAEIALKADGGYKKRLELDVEVIDRLLPPASEWSYHLDLWQHPSSVAEVEGYEMWSDDHFRAMEPTMRLLADAGQKVITATLNKDPWNCQTQYPYADMILWTRLADGSWEYDFAVFDRWVEFMMGLGIDKAINCYSLLPWKYELHYKDDVTGQDVTVSVKPGTPEFKEVWTPFLAAFSEHLSEKGWLGITNIAMDEQAPEVMEAATELLAEAAPELGIALADNHFAYRRYPHIKDMSVTIFADMDVDDILRRRAEGKVSTYYVCCSSGFPNTYPSSEPLEPVYLAWYALAHEFDGLLRWSYNSWPTDPIRDARFRGFTAGDTFIVYPEGCSAISFERLREGIQDWEKATRLRRDLAACGTAEAQARLQALDAAIAGCSSRDAFDGWQEQLNAAKRLLNAPMR